MVWDPGTFINKSKKGIETPHSMDASVKPKELAFPERRLGESPGFGPWNLV